MLSGATKRRAVSAMIVMAIFYVISVVAYMMFHEIQPFGPWSFRNSLDYIFFPGWPTIIFMLLGAGVGWWFKAIINKLSEEGW